MKQIKDILCTAVVLLLIILVAVFFQRIQFYKQLAQNEPDTVFVPKPYQVTIIKREYIEKPVKVLVYQKDTVLRKAAEQKDIITGVSITPQVLTIDKISPGGIIFSSKYQLPPFKEIKIDGQGNTQIKKKKHIGLKILSAAIVASTAAYFITR